MTSSVLDHIVIAAKTHDQGVSYIRDKLGVDIPRGGQHKFMGTHNSVMALGKHVYLEVISIDRSLNPPNHPRWFGLDDPHVRDALEESPRLLTWAVNTADLDSLVGSSAVPLGEIISASRDELRWRVAFRKDGSMPGAGFVPLCMQWKVDFHPASRMEDLGWKILSLQLYHHRPDWLEAVLETIGAREEVTVHGIEDGQTSCLEAVLSGQNGRIVRLR